MLVAGSLILDRIKTPHCPLSSQLLGGSAAYLAAAGSHFSAVDLLSWIGSDFPKHFLELLQTWGVQTDSLVRRDMPTLCWQGVYSEDFLSRETISASTGILEIVPLVVPDLDPPPELTILGSLHPVVQLDLLSLPQVRRRCLVDTMPLWVLRCPETVLAVAGLSSVFSLNVRELQLLTNLASLKDAAKFMLEHGVDWLVVKQGDQGATLFCADGCYPLPACLIRSLVDPTGAGDTFVAGMGIFLESVPQISVEVLLESIAFANVLASFTVEGMGTASIAALNPIEFHQRLSQYCSLVGIRELHGPPFLTDRRLH